MSEFSSKNKGGFKKLKGGGGRSFTVRTPRCGKKIPARWMVVISVLWNVRFFKFSFSLPWAALSNYFIADQILILISIIWKEIERMWDGNTCIFYNQKNKIKFGSVLITIHVSACLYLTLFLSLAMRVWVHHSIFRKCTGNMIYTFFLKINLHTFKQRKNWKIGKLNELIYFSSYILWNLRGKKI